MSEKQKMCTVVDLPAAILASLFAVLMFTRTHNQFPLLTMMAAKNGIGRVSEKRKNLYIHDQKSL